MRILNRYFHLWGKLTLNSFLIALSSRFSAVIFVIGKLLRFGLFLVFLITLFNKTKSIASYTVWQGIFFFLTFNLIDTTTQLFFREVYRFRQLVVSGDFDLVLVKPMSPLFRALAGGADPLDMLMLIPYLGGVVWAISQLGSVSPFQIGLYLIFLANGILIAAAFHILVLAMAVVTVEIDNAIMIYRDLTFMARIPVDIYQEPLRSIITFVIPIGVMMTFPAKAFLGLLTFPTAATAFIIGGLFLFVSLKIWHYSLALYSSASS